MKDKEEKTKEWIYKADHDLGSAKIIFIGAKKYYDTIAFHCQQAVEKYIKALMIYFEIDIKRTHDIVFLLEALSDKINIPDELTEKALSLEGLGVEIRYPDHKINITETDLKNIIEITEKFRKFVMKNIDFDIDGNELTDT